MTHESVTTYFQWGPMDGCQRNKKHMILTITGNNTILLSHLNVRTSTVLMTNLNNRHIYITNQSHKTLIQTNKTTSKK